MNIDRIETNVYRIPLAEPVELATHGVLRDLDLLMVRLWDTDGAMGCGYSTLNAGHGPATAMIIERVFADLIMGEDPRRIEWLWQRMWRAHHYSGRGGPVTFALAAVDIGLWDLRGRCLGEPLWRLLGGHDPKVPAYIGNIDLGLPRTALLEGASRSLEAGYRALKMRLGRPTLREDLARVAAMRDHIGPDIALMADANEAWRVDQTVRAMHGLRDIDLVWLEEPIRPDDFAGYAHLRRLGLVPIAAGENLHTLAEFTALISAGGVDFPEPDVTTCGGITPWLKIARLAEAHGLPITSHGAQDIHVHLLAAVPNTAYLEIHAARLDDYIAEQYALVDGHAVAPDRPGHGLEFDWQKLGKFS